MGAGLHKNPSVPYKGKGPDLYSMKKLLFQPKSGKQYDLSNVLAVI